MTEQEIFQKLLPLVREVTGARPEQIKMDSSLMQDLGAESIDLLDFSFLIEEEFDVTIESDEFERQATERIPEGVFEKDGLLTDEALEELKKALPEIPSDQLKPGLKKIELPSVLNVAVFVHLVQRKLTEKLREDNNA
jgi:acyl carrier protein